MCEFILMLLLFVWPQPILSPPPPLPSDQRPLTPEEIESGRKLRELAEQIRREREEAYRQLQEERERVRRQKKPDTE